MNKKPSEKSVCVNVGCGSSPTPGWLNLDGSFSVKWARTPGVLTFLRCVRLISKRNRDFGTYARENEIYHGDIRRLPLADNSCDAVYSCHMFEHILRRDVAQVLQEMKRVIKPGGIVRIAVPDLKRMAEIYLKSEDADRFMEETMLGYGWDQMSTIRGGLRMAAVGNPSAHKWMYDGNSLVKLLTSHGFKEATALEDGQTKIPQPGELNLAERSPESVFVEARK